MDANKVRAYLYGSAMRDRKYGCTSGAIRSMLIWRRILPTAGNFGYNGVELLTMRVIVPKRSYEAIAVEAERAQVRLTICAVIF